MASPAAVLSVLVQAEGIAHTTRQVKGLQGDLGKADKTVGKFGKNLEDGGKRGSKALTGLKSAAGLAGIAFGAAGLAAGVKSAVGEFREAQKVGAQTNAVIKSTGGAANVTAKHVGELATAISRKVGIDDEAIQSGSNLLLTFKGVRNEVGKGNDIFDQATQTITDMSVSLKQGLKPSAIQLGKALNDPVKGITALGRVGVTFTEGQKKMIEGMVKAGDTLGAQKIILKELKSEFGGSAAAAATAGDKLKVSLGNLAEAAGSVLVPAMDKVATLLSALFDGMVQNKGIGGALVSTFKGLGGAIAEVVSTIRGLIQGFKDGNAVAILLTTAIGAATAAFVVYKAIMIAQTVATVAATAATTALDVALAVLTSPITLVVAALALLAAAVIYAYKHSETFRKIVNGLWATLKVVAGWLVTTGVAAFNLLAGAVKAAWGVVKTSTETVWGGIKTYLTGEWNAIKAIASTVWGAIKFAIINPIRAVWDALSGKDGLWAKIQSGAEAAWGRIKTGVGNFASGVASTVTSAFEGVTNKVIDFVNTIIDVVNKIPGVPNIKKIGHIGGGGGGKDNVSPVHPNLAKGGMVPGSGYGDKVPLHLNGRLAAMVEPGELVSVTNRKATAALMGVNSAVPRFAGGGTLNVQEMADLWGSKGGALNVADTMGVIGLVESGGNPNARNPSGASGLWQILGQLVPGNIFNPGVNALNAIAKYKAQGLSAWDASKSKWGPLIGKKVGPDPLSLISKLPGVGGLPDWIQGLGKYALSHVTDWIKDNVVKAVTGGGGTASATGPDGIGTYNGMPMANWVIGSLKYGLKHGAFGVPTSGYRSHAQNVAAGRNYFSEHEGTQYPHGAVDFGGYHSAQALAEKMSYVNATAGYKYPLLAPKGFIDDGHASGTGHMRGGVLPFLGSYHSGGVAPREGFAHVSAGERMTPAGRGALVHIEHAEFGSQIDINQFAQKIGFKIATA